MTNHSAGLLLAGLLLGTAAATPAQQPTFRDSLLDRFVGNWVLRGTIQDGPVTHDVSAEWVLAHQYVRMHEVSRERDSTGAPEYEANVYIGWDPAAKQYVCIWLDVFGGISAQSVGRATPAANRIAFVFSIGLGQPGFHTTFIYDQASDRWSWEMDNVEDGRRAPFARVSLTRSR